MKPSICGAAIVAALAMPASAADTMSGNWMYEACRSNTVHQQHACLGFSAGSLTMFGLLGGACGDRLKKVTVGQAQDLFIKYLREHPEQRHLPASMVFFIAVDNAFRCTRISAGLECRNRMPVIAGLIHQTWEQGAFPGERAQWPGRDLPFEIGAGLSVALTTIREDPLMGAMTKDQFIAMAISICEPIYEAVFDRQ